MVRPQDGVAGRGLARAGAAATISPASPAMSRRRMLRLGAGMLGAAGLAGATLAGAGAAPAAESPGGGNNGEMASLAVEQPIATGQYIANFALQFQGYPYVWAGNTPAGFDCSGFTQYVILNTLGYDIGHGVAGQTGYGAWVDWGAWQPGDLVYFAGTYRAGISHTGVYIGDGLFIHAENEGTGVVVSSIHSGYYAGHYYGAYRHG